MAEAGLQWVPIRDFTPGIRQTVTPNQPPGVADASGTWNCVVNDGGVLVASPKRQQGFSLPANPIAPASNQAEQFRITGLHCLSPIANNGGTGTQETGFDANESEIWLMYEWYTGDHRFTQLSRLSRFVDPQRWEGVWLDNTASPYLAQTRPRNCYFMTGRSNHSATGVPGIPVLGWNAADHAFFFPDDTSAITAGTTSTQPLPAAIDVTQAPVGCVSHQGRAVIFPLGFYGHGAGATNATNEQFHWSAVNDWRTIDPVFSAGFPAASVSYDDTGGGFQIWASMTANELLLGKARGGAVVVRGDLNAFQAINLPNFMSPGYSLNVGCKSPIGWVYPVDNGTVWLWSGGDLCQNLADFMEPNFWRPTDSIPANGPTGRAPFGFAATAMCSWGKYVVTPNNWMFDTVKNSWWRLDDPTTTTLNYWRVATDATQRWLYASPSGFKDTSTPLVYEYDAHKRNETFYWKSHPLEPTHDRRVICREVIVVASLDPQGGGSGTVTVKVTSDQDSTGQSQVYNITAVSGQPHAHRAPAGFGVTGSNIVISVTSQSSVTGIPAPRIHELRVGLDERTRMGRTPAGDE